MIASLLAVFLAVQLSLPQLFDQALGAGLLGECWLARVEIVDIVLGDDPKELPGYSDECFGCSVEVDD